MRGVPADVLALKPIEVDHFDMFHMSARLVLPMHSRPELLLAPWSNGGRRYYRFTNNSPRRLMVSFGVEDWNDWDP